MIWYVLFFLVILKIPVLYLCYIIWWAVKDPPVPGEGFAGGDAGRPGGPGSAWWRTRIRPRPPVRRGPHGLPARRPASVTLARVRRRTPT